jgi:hypothetical protein
VYCSAFVKRLYATAGLDIVPGVSEKNTAPHDVANSPLPHTKYLLLREMPGLKIVELGKKLKTRIDSRLGKIRDSGKA